VTLNNPQQYRFKTEAQWNTCLFSQVDLDSLRSNGSVGPFPPFAADAARYESQGAQAPVVLRSGEILWADDHGLLHRSAGDDTTSETSPAPASIARARRVLSAAGSLWVQGAQHGSLECYDEASLTRLMTVELQGTQIVDIAAGGGDTILVLAERDGTLQCIRVSCAGRELGAVTLTGVAHASAFVFLRRSQRFVVLGGAEYSCLYWFEATGGRAIFTKPVGAIQPCFEADLLASDSNEKIVLAGNEGDASARRASVLILDADGNRLADVPLAEAATGIAVTRQNLIVTDAHGLLRYATTDVVPDATAEAQCTLVTPMLQALDVAGRPPWLRVDATTTLPEGTTLEISYASTEDLEVRGRLQANAQDVRLSENQRIQKLLGEPGLSWHKTTFSGRDPTPTESAMLRSAPLFDLRERYLWVSVTLTAARGARLPALTELAVVYAGRSLIENLPTPYRRAAAQPGDFLRSLVGVLETTTQDIDARIAVLGSHIHPSTATGPWMDYIARWLGLPWDDGLSDAQKRCILLRAADLAKGRGTRAGLEALLACLMLGSPARFRVTDSTGDFGFAVVGGERCEGSVLPAMLGGFTRWHAELDSSTELGYTRLPCAGQFGDPAQRFTGKIRIEVAASAEERATSEPWLLALLTQMVPLTATVELRWVNAQALRGDRLVATLTLEPPPDPHLGTDAVTGLARLPQARRTRLAGSGPAIGTRLR
jgi:phage tail-like protein